MNRAERRLFIRRGTALLIAAGLLALAACGRGPDLSSAVHVQTAPRIDPDYAGIVMPPNIAPLNFRVLEEGRDCVVRISSDAAETLELPVSRPPMPNRHGRVAPTAQQKQGEEPLL